ncbi:tRNA lysidine(34) synthetase TilS [Shimazuella kribbensis]|uniref:tRNA lysidine(34) synthetase TilS n=1 Tax=Shimazuella kribbensis TaxID=139808 RepID=UPI00040A4BF1|nr:tRNA lysidine(34) synthetase TilS [Shimazuella kribbensis]
MFLAKLETHIRANKLFRNNERLLVGVSGGCDSIALLDALYHLTMQFGWQVYVVHVNHHLRGEESDADARFVADFCQERNISYQHKHVDVKAKLKKEGGNKQSIARELRYQAFQDAAQSWGIKKIVLAHHADDQVETILMRIIRGTGPTGLAGIPVIRKWGDLEIVRPLLYFYRKELAEYLNENNINYREDSSNQSTEYTRNRLRLELIPELIQYNPQIKQSILQLGSMMADEEAVWEKWTNEALGTCLKKINEKEYQISLPSFLSYPVALQRRMVKLILNCLTDENLLYQSIEQVLQLGVHPSPSVWIFLPGGIKGVRSYEVLRLTKDYINKGEEKWSYPFSVPSKMYIPQGAIESIISSASTPYRIRESHHNAIFDADELNLAQLVVRNRRPGDKIQPFGFSGHKRVKSLLMEHKIPQVNRGNQPIVVSDQEIIWIPGIRRSAVAPVTSSTTKFLILDWTPDKASSLS